MEFPGFLGVALWRLKGVIQTWPLAALGPFFGIISAALAIDVFRRDYASVALEIVIAPLIAVAVLEVARRDHTGPSGLLMFVLGLVSGFGASVLLARGATTGSALMFTVGLRHLTVMAYAWASIATEPPVRRRNEFAFVRV